MDEELRLLTLLEHPHIVRTLSLCEDEEKYYISFELLKSGNLAEVLRKIKEKSISFTEADAANLIQQILLAISYLHSTGVNVVHRDLKLENIMVDIERDIEKEEQGQTKKSQKEKDKRNLDRDDDNVIMMMVMLIMKMKKEREKRH